MRLALVESNHPTPCDWSNPGFRKAGLAACLGIAGAQALQPSPRSPADRVGWAVEWANASYPPCAASHGLDGTLELVEDGEFTLGGFARQKAYEGWYKVLAGHPGSTMGAKVPADLSVADQAAWILDVFAALCDREAYPVTGASGEDVEDGDLRCGEYLR